MSEREKLKQAAVRALEELWSNSDECPRGVWPDVVDCVLDTIESLTQQWRKFDKDDETTYPDSEWDSLRVWTITNGEVLLRPWINKLNAGAWHKVSHWQPIQTPLPPENES